MDEIREERVVPVHNAGLVKRTFAALLDVFIFLAVFFMLQGMVVFPIARSIAKDYDSNSATYIRYYKESTLAILDEKTNQLMPIDEKDYVINSEHYYNVYCSSEYEGVHACSVFGKSFREVMEEDENFKEYISFDENDNLIYIIPDEYKESEENSKIFINNINVRIYDKALRDLQKSELFFEPYQYVTKVQNYSMFASIALSALIVYLLPALITKNGKTIGKMVFKLAITNSEGFAVKKSQIIVRFLAFAVINIFLGRATYMFTTMISFMVMIFSKRNSALHDYCAVTKVVDEKTSVIYKNKSEFESEMDREETRFAEIEESRKKYYSSKEN